MLFRDTLCVCTGLMYGLCIRLVGLMYSTIVCVVVSMCHNDACGCVPVYILMRSCCVLTSVTNAASDAYMCVLSAFEYCSACTCLVCVPRCLCM